jgi:hypothetical protein
MNNDKQLQFIAEHLEEWPDDRDERVRVDKDGEIMFDSCEYDFYPKGFNRKSRVFEESSNWYTREQWQEARNDHLAKYDPKAGDVVDIKWALSGNTSTNCIIKYIGDDIFVYEQCGTDYCKGLGQVTITPHKPDPTPQEIMLGDWRSFNSLDEAYDNMMSNARIGDVFDALVSEGWVKDLDK